MVSYHSNYSHQSLRIMWETLAVQVQGSVGKNIKKNFINYKVFIYEPLWHSKRSVNKILNSRHTKKLHQRSAKGWNEGKHNKDVWCSDYQEKSFKHQQRKCSSQPSPDSRLLSLIATGLQLPLDPKNLSGHLMKPQIPVPFY